MRILTMADTPPNADSGAAGTEYQTIGALRAMGHEVDALWADDLGRRIQHGNLHYILELPLVYRRRMLERLHKGGYDVVHVNQPHGWLAARALRGHPSNAVFVHRSHGFESRAVEALAPWRHLEAPRPLLRRAAGSLLVPFLQFNNDAIARHAHGHIVSGQLCADFLRARLHVPAERIAVIPQAPPIAYQSTPAAAFDSKRLDRLLYVGQLAFFKAPTIVAQAFERIAAQSPEATLTWVCSQAHHPQVLALLGPLGRERVRLRDWTTQSELMRTYDEHGVFLFPSFFEGFGKAFLEAMARGLVVIASAEGGARSLIADGVNGMLVAPGDAPAIARAYESVRRMPDQAASLRAEARATALQYTWQRVARETTAFYERLRAMR